jgi:hypothetical protein
MLTLEQLYYECRNSPSLAWISRVIGPYIVDIPNTPENKAHYYYGGLGVRKDKVMVTMHYGEWHKTYQVSDEVFDKVSEVVRGHPSKAEICEAKRIECSS